MAGILILINIVCFYTNKKKNNHSFAKTIERYRLLKKNDHLLETVSSKEIDSVSLYLKKDSILIESGYGTIYCNSIIPNLEYPTCYISNGIYHDTEKIALNLIGCGSFIIGICDNPDSIFYKENLEKIKKIEKLLDKKHIKYKEITYINHRDKCKIISYRSETLW